MSKKILIALVIIMLLILGWAPWLSNDDVRVIVRTYSNFQEQHSAEREQENPEIVVTRLPFCRLAATYEGAWSVCFWQTPKK
ncbi:MAG: hypothetical protein A2921_02010 [Candidatus Magasanikbacteria bacterium RIFCSPLOWO2_01_FULL_43_20b]|uniref:Uncharacterized protein n=1 Tax=Candidatus Magasanikbacteria bacterium RIFCSPLOWO2_12_FULL_43_12 TaxID=1798692 RepID=A0A1F6MQL3_9BACT|nr:MAG: hypothetical protein A3C74_02310 [Candidatus Magasanikbacteria bacterium RIFCSPHIGHO2_02_FULL_44_13]OGH71951.1 MAG: hypothetical protein A3I93_02945 [Candidatus Magasanikbacteria bacterium RIFCSPLOWO2_02_FULL_43_22]OGH73665.1 MAG: hypothetical protein A2921_02010 [Candidatus Magasanikbacteria bacterium RIFCSPLOWO2_01_FULL_43_20b]OGH73954.1 MAG: hypothetical protein A3G00_03550 [Candidatus Magasanikbacteria bacterium RIFCSPLOWO2_12_FULL_43_12]